MDDTAARLLEALHSAKPVQGLTHRFYRYPAGFPPEVARELILQFSSPDDWILDPFMGGGTSVVESLALGRRVIGVDINSLAHFVTTVKTTPLNTRDYQAIRDWGETAQRERCLPRVGAPARECVNGLPMGIRRFLMRALPSVESLRTTRQRRFARCVLLRTAQKALDCVDGDFTESEMASRLREEGNRMLLGMSEFVEACRQAGVRPREIPGRRLLLTRSAVGLETDQRAQRRGRSPVLVLTSPPYAGVHVLYHRWQIAGRRESAAPYWICGLTDGRTASYYTLGARSARGEKKYFDTLRDAYASVARMLPPGAIVAQIVGFSRSDIHLRAFLRAMDAAGFDEIFPLTAQGTRLWRTVPNRRWYAKHLGETPASREALLFHRRREDRSRCWE